MHEPTLLPVDEDTVRRRVAISAMLAVGVLASAVGGWLLFAHALSSSGGQTGTNFTARSGAASETGSPSSPPRSLDPATAGTRGTTVLRMSSRGTLIASASYTFKQSPEQIWLSVPPQPSSASGHGFAPVITHLRISVPGRPTREISGEFVEGSSVSVPIPADTAEVRMAYAADGVVVRSKPSAQGRAVLLLTPVEVRTGAKTMTKFVFADARVISFGCEVNGSPATACGSRNEGGWQVIVDSTLGDIRIVAGIDLAQQ